MMMYQMMMHYDHLIKKRILKIQQNINQACKRAKRNPKDIILIAVTKGKKSKDINIIIEQGIYNFGENKIQEFLEKKPQINSQQKLTHHFIGHLQTNKIKKAINNFHFIHTLDSYKKIKKMNTISKNIERIKKIFLQINIGDDPNKKGFNKHDFLDIINQIQQLKFIQVVGIMTITPNIKDKKKIRKYYRETKRLQEKTQKTIKTCSYISMGMTNDYEIAIEEGATHIRVGRGFFNE